MRSTLPHPCARNNTTRRLLSSLLFNLLLFLSFALMPQSTYARQSPVGGYPMPTLDDEKATYRSWGWTWDESAEPDFPGDPNYVVVDPDIHGDTEGDDLWTYLMMYLRTNEQGYLDRARAWARYFMEDYRNCVGGTYSSFCYDRDAFGADHLYGWGLIAWYEAMGESAALTEAENLGAVLEELYGPNTSYGCLPANACIEYGVRAVGRHLLFMTRLAEVTQKARWITLRDRIIDLLLATPQWDEQRGMYFLGEWSTDQDLGEGAYAAGARIQSPFMLGVLSEALDHAYRTTGREEIRNRMIAMARFVDKYGLDSTYQYCGSLFGIVDGKMWHNYSAKEPVTFWDPVYTTSLVNTLVRGYKYTGDRRFYERAKYFFNRGTKGIYGEPVRRSAGDTEVDHFVDTRFASSHGNFYLAYNKGELQYTYLLFENGGNPVVSVESAPNRVPDRFMLEQNYPNPFNPKTTIRFSLPQRGHISLKVYDVLGREVATLIDDERTAGEHTVVFDAGYLTSGVYFYRLETGLFNQTRKAILMK